MLRGALRDVTWFVAHDDGSYSCEHCIPRSFDVGSENVDTWDVNAGGWLAEVRCSRCAALLAEPDDEE